jgi:predicted SAM-dependent methyltransferase
MLQATKKQIKTHKGIYRLAKKFRDTVRSIPYTLQALKPKQNNHNLMLGYSGKVERWITFDIVPGADYLGDIKNLELFKSNSMNKVYASHVLEHVNCDEALIVIKEVHRVLKPGGIFFVAVPDLVNISNLLKTEYAETAIDIIFGVNRRVSEFYPQHKYGYTKELLEKKIVEAGFVDIAEFEPFLDDTSLKQVGTVQVSICLSGRKKG